MDESEDVVMESSDDQDVAMGPCHEAPPALEAISEGEDSCGSVVSSSSSLNQSSLHKKSSFAKKRVSWDRIHTRNFSLVVGDHPLCQDGLPVSLGWQHADEERPAPINVQAPKVRERTRSYAFPPRLSYEERRKRLCIVSGLTENQVQDDEIDLVIRTLQEAYDQVSEGGYSDVNPTPLAEDMMAWEEVLGQDLDVDVGDITDFEWTD